MDGIVDARGLACPAPVVRTRDALRGGAERIEVLVDNPAARDNVCRFAASQGCAAHATEEGGIFRIAISKTGDAPAEAASTRGGMHVVVVLSGDIMGRGDRELGEILVKAFLNTLAENEPPPWRVVLFNSGVKLALEGTDTARALRNLERLGVEVLVCGTCLDFFGMKERLAAGAVSNMYDIIATMLSASSTVSV